MSTRRSLNSTVLIVATVGSLVLLNLLSVRCYRRADLTRDGEFTLSQATIDTLEALDDPVTVRAYITKDLPLPYSQVAQHVKDLLDEYYANGKGNFRYEIIDPSAEETEEDKQKKKDIKRDLFGRMVREKTSVEQELERLGIVSYPAMFNDGDRVEQRRAYTGVVVKYGGKSDKTEVIAQVRRPEGFEIELTTRIRKVSRKNDPKLALITGHDNPSLNEHMRTIQGMLKNLFQVTTIDLTKKAEIADDVDAILVVGPKTPLSEQEQRAIDRFILSGHAAAFLLGPVAPQMETLQANPIEHGLADMLATYGVRIEPGLVLDTACGNISVARQLGGMREIRQVPYPFLLTPKALRADHPLTRKLAHVTLPFIGPLGVAEELPPGVEAEVLVKSSPNGWIQTAPFNLDPYHRWRKDEVGDMAQRDLMVSLSGAIPSHFPDQGDPERPPAAQSARVLVVNGHAFLQDQFLSAGNRALVLNLMDWLVMDEALLAMRARGLTSAALDELTDTERSLIKTLNIIGLPVVFVGFGLARWRLREGRRRRVKP